MLPRLALRSHPAGEVVMIADAGLRMGNISFMHAATTEVHQLHIIRENIIGNLSPRFCSLGRRFDAQT